MQIIQAFNPNKHQTFSYSIWINFSYLVKIFFTQDTAEKN